MNAKNQIMNKPKYIAVTGGKGGTGKTLISVNLAIQIARSNKRVLLVDCDTENPNTYILMNKNLDRDSREKGEVKIFKPVIDPDKCSKCGICREACYRHAILQFPNEVPSIFDHMCSGCQTCMRVCPADAITSIDRKIGNYYVLPDVYQNMDLLVGELTEGEALSVKIVEELIDIAQEMLDKNKYDVILLDSPPGAHCDVETILKSADLIVSVTEPTPFGEHDLGRILQLIKLINKKTKVIINRANLTDYKEPIINMLKNENSEILGEIPVDRIIIEDYAKGNPFVLDEREFPGKTAMMHIYNSIENEIGKKTED